jgi:hypothetical protein
MFSVTHMPLTCVELGVYCFTSFHSMYKIIKVQIMTGFGWSLIKKELGGSESAGTFITY